MRKTVLCQRNDRLGARLKNLVYAFIFSRQTSSELTINWSPDDIRLGTFPAEKEAGHRIKDIFDPDLCAKLFPWISLTNCDFKKTKHSFLDQHGAIELQLSPSATREYFLSSEVEAIYYGLTVPYRFSDADPISSDDVREILDCLPWSQPVKSALKEAASLIPLEATVCVHIRRGDLISLGDMVRRCWANENRVLPASLVMSSSHFVPRYAPLSAYKQTIERIALRGCSILLMSDDPNVKSKLAHTYSHFAIDYDTISSRLKLSQCQRDLFEFLLIRCCASVICTESAFSEFAAFSGGKQTVNPLACLEADSFIEDLATDLGLDLVTHRLFLIELIKSYSVFCGRRPSLHSVQRRLESFLSTETDDLR